MYKIIIDDLFHDILDDFFISYRNIFKNLYTDTGIPDEYMLYETYEQTSKKMKDNIMAEIDNILIPDFVWYKILDWKRSIKIFLKSFMLEIFYEEDIEEKIRFIENIEINKK